MGPMAQEDAFVDFYMRGKTKAFPWVGLGGLSLDQDKIFTTRYHYAQCFYQAFLPLMLCRLS